VPVRPTARVALVQVDPKCGELSGVEIPEHHRSRARTGFGGIHGYPLELLQIQPDVLSLRRLADWNLYYWR
jgi:hypothetical protein